MKRGVVVLEQLVKLVPTILGILVIAAIVISVYVTLSAQERTAVDRNYNRVVADARDVIDSDFAVSITVPLEGSDDFLMIAYPADVAPPACSGRSCLCRYVNVDGQYKEYCRTLDVERCPEGCSKKSCLPDTVEIPSKAQITVSRDDCGRLLFT